MFEFDNNISSKENVKRLIQWYQTFTERFPKIYWGKTEIVINPITAKEFGLKDGQSIDTICFCCIISSIQERLMALQFDEVMPSDFEETKK